MHLCGLSLKLRREKRVGSLNYFDCRNVRATLLITFLHFSCVFTDFITPNFLDLTDLQFFKVSNKHVLSTQFAIFFKF